MDIATENTAETFDVSLDNLLNTRDMSVYLDALAELKEKYLIILSVKGTPEGISDDVFEKLHTLGFSKLLRDQWRAYAGVIDRGNVLFDACNEDTRSTVGFFTEIENLKLIVFSQPRANASSRIQINDEDYSFNCRGLNIVVYDYSSNQVIDSVTYDAYPANPFFYHMNFFFTEEYCASHFFVPKKYKETFRLPFIQKCFSNREPAIKAVAEEGVILPKKTIKGISYGGACDKDFNFIAGHENFSVNALKNSRVVMDSYIPDEPVEYIDEEVIYGGIIYSHPGHLIIESVAEFLWYAVENFDANTKIAVERLMWDESFFLEYIDILGIPRERIIFVTKPIRFKKLIIPDPSALMRIYCEPYEFTDKFKAFFEAVKRQVTPANYKKIYLTKSKTIKGNMVGEDLFIDYYRSKGFEIINPEDYSLREKIALMMGADEVATVAGTNHLFFIFCKPTTKVTVLTRVYHSCYNTAVMEMISEITGIKDLYVVNVSNNFFDKDYVYSLFLLTMTDDFKKYAKAYFNDDIGDKYSENVKDAFFEYLKYMPEYYSKSSAFNAIKNLKMTTVLQNISEVFYGKDFDTTGLNLQTNEDKLRDQVEKLTEQLSAAKKRIEYLEKSKGSFSIPKIASGSVSVIPDKANEPKKVHVKFPEGIFTSVPSVVATPKSLVPGTVLLGVGVSDITETGFDICVTRKDTTRTGICWIAVQS